MAQKEHEDLPVLKPLAVAQYREMSENRRVYEKYIWQTPPIVVAILGVIYGLTLTNHFVDVPKFIASGGLMVLSAFVGIIGYWEFRCRILLRIIEANLREFEEKCGYPEFVMYVKEINPSLPWYKRQSSTLMILLFLWGLALLLFAAAIAYLVL